MRKIIQFVLFLFAVIALIVTGVAFYQIVLAATLHGAPVRFIDAQGGPYPFKLALYQDPINAGDVLPFAISVPSGMRGTLTYQVTASPGSGVPGSLAQGDVNAQQRTPYGVPGSITLVTRGSWTLHIALAGPAGRGEADIPLTAVALPAMPAWLAWNIGLLPVYGLLLFWVGQTRCSVRQRLVGKPPEEQALAAMAKEGS